MNNLMRSERSESGIPRLGVGWMTIALVLLLAAGTGCSGDDGNENKGDETSGIEISGTWSSNRGATFEIGADTWVTQRSSGTTTYTVVSYDNDKNRVIRKSEFMGETSYDRTVWTEPSNGEFYFCTAVFGKSSKKEAQNAQPQQSPDFDNPESSDACGGMFPFTKLTEGAAPTPDAGTGDAGSSDASNGDAGS